MYVYKYTEYTFIQISAQQKYSQKQTQSTRIAHLMEQQCNKQIRFMQSFMNPNTKHYYRNLSHADDGNHFNRSVYGLDKQCSKKIKIVSVKNMLCKPKQLIDKSVLNKVYPEEWPIQPTYSQGVQAKNQYDKQSELMYSSTQNQCRNIRLIESISNKNYKKQSNNISNIQGNKTIVESQQWHEKYQVTKIYGRFKSNQNNLWSVDPQLYRQQSYQMNSAFQIYQKDPKQQNSTNEKLPIFEFNSKFQSGNLLNVYHFNRQKQKQNSKSTNQYQSDRNYYRLTLHNDTNTQGYNNWFYFAVKSSQKYETAKFQIINMRKDYSLFNKGMKIAILIDNDKKLSQQQKYDSYIGWHRGGENIQYSQNQFVDQYQNKLYSLSFQYTFNEPNKWVYFAYSYPYTYTQLKRDCKYIVGDRKLLNISTIGLTPLKNQVLCIQNISIPVYNSDQEKQKRKNKPEKKKDILLVMARAHPSETPGSFIMRGFMKEIVSNSSESEYLRSNFIIKIIPMINPDGVIHGNTRTSFTGNDLNRRWTNPDKNRHSEIYSIKSWVQGMYNKGHRIFMMVDFHGHSKKQNAFFYGCRQINKLQNASILSRLLSKLDDNFSQKNCSYTMSAEKSSTARISCFRQFSSYSYTLQSSYLGASKTMQHFSIRDFEYLGRNLIKAIAIFKDYIDPCLKKNLLCSFQLKKQIVQLENRQINQIIKDQSESDEESNSAPSQFNHDDQFIQNIIYAKDKRTRLSLNKRYKNFRINQSFSSQKSPPKFSSKRNLRDNSPQLLTNRKKEIPSNSQNSKQYTSNMKKIQQKSNQLNTISITSNNQNKDKQVKNNNVIFSAFNFKARKGTNTRKKKLLPDITIST